MRKKINPKKFYTLYEIVKDELIPGATIYNRLKNIVLNDYVVKGPLQAVKLPRGLNGSQYNILGINIIKYLAMKDDQKTKKD